jgi:hypothetical protein
MSTSALAEGVNLSGLRTLAVGAVVTGKTSNLAATKVLQMIGRLDREDQGGVAMVPPSSALQTGAVIVKPTNIIVDIIGRPVPTLSFDRLVGLSQIDVKPSHLTWISRDEADVMLGVTDTSGTVFTDFKLYRAWGLSPYHSSVTIHAYPVAVHKKKAEAVAPTTFSRLVRFLAQEDVMPIHIFALTSEKAELLTILPPSGVILVIILFCRKVRGFQNQALDKGRVARLERFLDAREALFKGEEELKQFHQRVTNVIVGIGDHMTVPASEQTGFVGYRWQSHNYSKMTLRAFAAYIVDFIQCTHHLDYLTGTWATYAEWARGVPMAYDFVVGVLSENVVLPILHAQRHFYRMTKIAPLAQYQWHKSLLNPHAAFAAMYRPLSDNLQGHPVQPTTPTRESGHIPPIPPRMVIENHVLIIGVAAAEQIVACLKPDTEPSFAFVHQTLQANSARAYTDRARLTKLGCVLTASPSAPTRREVGTGELPEGGVRGVERYLGVDWWGRLPVTVYSEWDEDLDLIVTEIERNTAQARARYADLVKKSGDVK